MFDIPWKSRAFWDGFVAAFLLTGMGVMLGIGIGILITIDHFN